MKKTMESKGLAQPGSAIGGGAAELRGLLAEIVLRHPPVKALPHHWLSADAGDSYCYACARKAVAADYAIVDTGEPESRWHETEEERDTEELYRDAIDGGYGYSGECENAAACETCGSTLSYVLTDYGVRSELDFADEASFIPGGETTYWAERIEMALDWGGAPVDLVAVAAKVFRGILAATTPPSHTADPDLSPAQERDPLG